jgi:hypothetical protein
LCRRKIRWVMKRVFDLLQLLFWSRWNRTIQRWRNVFRKEDGELQVNNIDYLLRLLRGALPQYTIHNTCTGTYIHVCIYITSCMYVVCVVHVYLGSVLCIVYCKAPRSNRSK